MSLNIRSKDINPKTKTITINSNENISNLNILLIKNNNLNPSIIDLKSNITVCLKLLDLNNSLLDNFNYTSVTKQGIAYFKNIEINTAGKYILLVDDVNNKYKSDSVYVLVNNKILDYRINLVDGKNKILKDNSEMYIFNIVDSQQRKITSFNNNPLPPLNIYISYFKKGNSNLEHSVHLQIKPNLEGYYHFIFYGFEEIIVKIIINLKFDNLDNNINIPDFHLNIETTNNLNNETLQEYPILNSRYLSNRLNNTFRNYDFNLSEDIYIRKKIWLNNELFQNKPSNKLFRFESNLSCSQQLNYKLKSPQENFSVPQRVDNSIGSTIISIPSFNPNRFLDSY